MHPWIVKASLALTTAWLAMAPAFATTPNYPNRPIRIIVNTAPGGLTDVTARLLAQHMGEFLKQPIIVDNRAGGDGLIGIRAVKSAPADGYTLLGTTGTVALQMAVRQEPGYDLLQDFTGIGIMSRSPFLMVVGASKPDKTFADFVARARANPGKLSFASAGVGTAPHLGMERIAHQLGLNVMHVPYKGNGPALPDVMAGRVDTILEAYGSSGAQVQAGQFRVLAVTSASRIPKLPNVPTVAESGLPQYSAYTWLSLIVPAGTPPAIVQRLSEALRHAKSVDAVKARFAADGVEAMDMTPDQFNQFMSREVATARQLVHDLGIPKQ